MAESTAPIIARLTAADAKAAVTCIADALQDEPGFSWVVPDPDRRAVVMRTLLGIAIRDALRFDHVWIAKDGTDVVGVAIWYAPGDHPMTARRSLRAAVPMLRLARFGRSTMNGLRLLGRNQEAHVPNEPCWYLTALGVAPGHQGRGVGSLLMRAALAEIDGRGEAAYLETGEEINVGFYRRFGFEVREAAIQMAPAPGPTHWTMRRERRSPT